MEESNYIKYRGKCKEYCQDLCRKDPSLRMVRGWYDDVLWGRQAHWWCVDLSGNIIDPTIDQFPTKCGEYIEFNGVVSCAECGKEIPEKEAIIMGNGNYAVCSQRCALSLVGL